MKVLEELAVVVHGGLLGGHALGACYNYRRSRGVDGWVLFHVLAAAASAFAVGVHLRHAARA